MYLLLLGISLTPEANRKMKHEFESLPELKAYRNKKGIPLPPWTRLVDRDDSIGQKNEWGVSDEPSSRVYLRKRPTHVLGK